MKAGNISGVSDILSSSQNSGLDKKIEDNGMNHCQEVKKQKVHWQELFIYNSIHILRRSFTFGN